MRGVGKYGAEARFGPCGNFCMVDIMFLWDPAKPEGRLEAKTASAIELSCEERYKSKTPFGFMTLRFGSKRSSSDDSRSEL